MKKRKTTSSLTLTLTLHEDMIVEILLRLPVRSLLRFKTVCKLWCSLISNPQFALSHFDKAIAPTHRLIMKANRLYEIDLNSMSIREVFDELKRPDELNCNSVDIEAPLDCNNSSKLVIDVPAPRGGCRTCMFGSCRGFLFLIKAYKVNRKSFFGFVIWNPTIGFQKHIKGGFARPICLTGFGYDSSTHDYLIVDLTPRWRYLKTSGERKWMEVRLFSLRTNSWTSLPDIELYYRCIGGEGGLLLNEALHWLVKLEDVYLIVAFDLRERRFSDIALPDIQLPEIPPSKIPLPPILAPVKTGHKVLYLVVIRGCLCVCLVHNGTTTVWKMEQYKVNSSWIKLFVLSSGCDPLLSKFYPIQCSTDGHLLGSNGNALVKVDDNGKLLEHYPHDRVGSFDIEHCVYRESLLSLHR